MLEALDLHFDYGSGEFALRVPELKVKAGQCLGLGGPSGIGKTTLLRLLAGILHATSGTVKVGGGPPSRSTRLKKLGLVFQDFALLDYLSVWENVLLPLRLSGGLAESHAVRAKELLEALEMLEHRDHLVTRLSQGERQRVAVARALVHAPAMVLADEPTSSLDARRKRLVMDLLVRHAREHQAGLLVVTHDVELFGRLDGVLNVEDWVQ